jgi:HK97 family phage prohead protease
MTELLYTFTAGLVVAAADAPERRTVSGRAVPFGEIGYTSQGPARVEAGALDLSNLPPLLRDHDPTKVIGRVLSAVADEDGVNVRARLSNTPLGDETLTLADDGALAGFSVSVYPTDYRFETVDGVEVLVIMAGEWRELSVVPFQAFPTARIHDVAASQSTPPPGEPMTIIEDPAVVDAATPPAIVATADVVPTLKTRDRLPAMTAGTVAQIMWQAQRGNPRAADLWDTIRAAQPTDVLEVLAALSGETTTTSDGIVPPSYTSDLLGGLPVATPFLSNLCRVSALPATGMSILKPLWEVVPTGAWVSAENTAAPSSPATIGSKTVGVLTYAHAVQASINLVERSAFGGYANAYYEQAGIDYLAKKESKAVATAQGAATAVAITATTTTGAIGQLVAAVVAQQTEPNTDGPEFRGLLPEYAAVSPDLWGDLVETKALDGPAFSSGSISWGSLAGSLSGLVVMAVPALTAGKILVGARAATVVHDQGPAQLKSVVVNTLSVELGIIGNCAIDVEYPAALAKGAAAFVPAGLAATGASKK